MSKITDEAAFRVCASAKLVDQNGNGAMNYIVAPYLIDDLRAALSASDAITAGERVGWDTTAEWSLERQAFQAAGRADVPKDVQKLVAQIWVQYCLAADPASSPPASELEAEIARLRSELEYQKKVSADRWETTERQAYAFDDMRIRAEAAEARLAEALKALEMFPELFLSFVGPVNDEWFNRFADAVKTARRVREGGKVDG